MRMVQIIVCAAALIASSGVRAEEPADPLAAFGFLVGSCWTAPFPDGKLRNTHCYTRSEDGDTIVDRHVVIGVTEPYGGESRYRWDAAERAIRYAYRASDGGGSRGTAVPTATGIDFPDEAYTGNDGGRLLLRGRMIREGDGYVSISEQRDGLVWKPLWRMRFTRSGPAPAHDAVAVDGLVVGKAIVRAAPAGEDAAGYVAIDNSGESDRLIAARCGCAATIELHRIVRADGKADMRNDWPLALPAGARAEIRPGSDLHLMLIGTKADLTAGETIPVTLVFEKAGAILVPFRAVADSAAAWAER